MQLLNLEGYTLTTHDKDFTRTLGQRIAKLRKEQGLTQTQLGELLDLSQQQVAHFETARRRVPASLLSHIAKTLAVTVEELIDDKPKPRRRGPTPKLQLQLEKLSQLPKSRQRFVSEMLDTVLQQAGR